MSNSIDPPAGTAAQRKVALVTGSGKHRVGHYVAEALVERGYAVAIHYFTSETDATETVAQLRGQRSEAIALQADLRDEAAGRRLVQDVIQHFGRIDVLVNCASVWSARAFEEVTGEDVRRNFQTNVLATFVCSQEAGLAMVRQAEGGCIVNFGDWAEARPYLNYSAYFASKGAIPALTRCLAVELGSRNPRVRVNCILPGPVLFADDLPDAAKRQAVQATLLKRPGSPEDVVQAVLFLIDNGFVTGASLPVDGGRSIYVGGS